MDNHKEVDIIQEKVVRFNGDICIKSYTKGRFLGKGGFARCYEFTSNQDCKRLSAGKVIEKKSLVKQRAK